MRLYKNTKLKPFFWTILIILKHQNIALMLLWFCLPKGTLVSKKITNIVGTRKNDFYGQDFCQKPIKYLAAIDPIIVPGFAYGIDVIAHKQALKLGLDKVGCLAYVFDKTYRKDKKKYIRDFEKKGVLLLISPRVKFLTGTTS